MTNNGARLSVKRLKKYFPVKAGVFRRTVAHVKAVDDISFVIRSRETGVIRKSVASVYKIVAFGNSFSRPVIREGPDQFERRCSGSC
jgi:ABC-type microcin C transport system duplicated ATPase subunit YejF